MEGLTLEEQKVELINDLISVTLVMEELWKYHPKNPNCTNILTEYEVLVKMKSDIENEIKTLK